MFPPLSFSPPDDRDSLRGPLFPLVFLPSVSSVRSLLTALLLLSLDGFRRRLTCIPFLPFFSSFARVIFFFPLCEYWLHFFSFFFSSPSWGHQGTSPFFFQGPSFCDQRFLGNENFAENQFFPFFFFFDWKKFFLPFVSLISHFFCVNSGLLGKGKKGLSLFFLPPPGRDHLVRGKNLSVLSFFSFPPPLFNPTPLFPPGRLGLTKQIVERFFFSSFFFFFHNRLLMRMFFSPFPPPFPQEGFVFSGDLTPTESNHLACVLFLPLSFIFCRKGRGSTHTFLFFFFLTFSFFFLVSHDRFDPRKGPPFPSLPWRVH